MSSNSLDPQQQYQQQQQPMPEVASAATQGWLCYFV